MSSNTNIINPKPCNYGCNTRIYWNTSENTYFEVFSRNRHQCPNRQQQQGKKASNNVTQTTTKPNYYKKSYFATQQQKKQQSKPKMSNSLELLQGPIAVVQKNYEILSDCN